MARTVHDATTKPIVVVDFDDDGKEAHRPDVCLVVEGPSGRVPVAGTADGKIKVDGASGGGSGGASATDEEAFDEGVTTFTPAGGVYDDTLTDLTAGQLGVGRITKQRASHVNLRKSDGTELGVAGGPLIVGDGGSSLTVDDGGSSLTVDTPQLPAALTGLGNLKVSIEEGGSSSVITDIEDGAGDSVMDASLNAIQAKVVNVPDGADEGLGATTDAEASGNGSLIAVSKRIRSRLDAILAALGGTLDVSVSNTPTVNQGTSPWVVGDGGGAISVDDNGSTISVDDGGGSVTVDGTVAISGAVDTELTTADLDTGAGTDTRAVVGLVRAESGGGVLVGSANPLPISVASLPLPSGAATEGTLALVLTQSDFDTKIGSLTEAAPATDTASSGLNGRLQRIAQRITSLIALLPSALTGSGNFKVSIAESTATVTADTELTTADLDTGAGTDTRAVVGLVLAASGGGLLVGAANPMPISDNLTTISVDDGGGQITVDGTVATTSADGGHATIGTTSDASSANTLVGLLKAIKSAVQGTLTVSGTVTTAAAPPIVDQVSIGGSNLTVKSIAVNATSSGNNTVVAAVVSKKIRVLGFQLLAAGKVDVIWRSATAGTIINAVSLDKYVDYSFMTGVGYALENTAGEALQLNLSAAIAVRGWIIYVEV